MQFRKASKKTNKEEIAEGPVTKHRRKAGSTVSAEAALPANGPVTKAAAAAAGAGSDVISSAAIDSVGVVAPASNAAGPESSTEAGQAREIRHEDIAKLAHSYWIARGYRHGSPEEDWLRAERELKGKR